MLATHPPSETTAGKNLTQAARSRGGKLGGKAKAAKAAKAAAAKAAAALLAAQLAEQQ